MRNWKVAAGVALCCCSIVFAAPPSGSFQSHEEAQGPGIDAAVNSVQSIQAERLPDQHSGIVPLAAGDSCFDAIVIPPDYDDFITMGALNQQAVVAPSCSNQGFDDKWFQVTVNQRFFHVDTCPDVCNSTPNPDTIVQVFSTCTFAQFMAGYRLGCSDDNCPDAAFNTGGALNFDLNAVEDPIGGGMLYDPNFPNADITMYIQVMTWNYGPNYAGDHHMIVQSWDSCEIACSHPDDWLELTESLGCVTSSVGAQAPIELPGCNTTVCGTSFYNAGSYDPDWYKLVLPDFGGTTYNLMLCANAEFHPVLSIVVPSAITTEDPYGCENYQVIAQNETQLPACETLPSPADPNNPGTACVTAYGVAAGTYYVAIRPEFLDPAGTAGNPAYYQLQVTSVTCDPAMGACCDGSTCTLQTRDDCYAMIRVADPNNPGHFLLDGRYYGDGTDCADVTCYVCPGGAMNEGETYNGDSYPFEDPAGDTFNPGCNADLTPVFKVLPFTSNGSMTVCGTTGLYMEYSDDPNLPLPVGATFRDTDWYQLGVFANSNPLDPNNWWPVGTLKSIEATVSGETATQLLVFKPGYKELGGTGAECSPLDTPDPNDPNFTWFAYEVVGSLEVPAAESGTISTCIEADFGSYGPAWVFVGGRGGAADSPYTIPVGARYTLDITVGDCTGTGACILPGGLCQVTDFVTCTDPAGLDGTYAGTGVACEDLDLCIICDPNDPTQTVEPEPVCFRSPIPPDYEADLINGGCQFYDDEDYDPNFGPLDPNMARYLPAPIGNVSVCALTGWTNPGDGFVYPDVDAWYINVTSTTDVEMSVYSDAQFNGYYDVLPNFPDCLDNYTETLGGTTTACALNTWTIPNLEPGNYLFWVRLVNDADFYDACWAYSISFETPGPSGACCFPDGSCAMYQAAECADAGGTYTNDGVDCVCDEPCPQIAETEACCFADGMCDELWASECALLGGTAQGAGSDCIPTPCSAGPVLCPGDANCDGFINFRDIDYFVAAQNDNVAAWEALFGGTPPCDFLNNDANSDGFVNFRDIDPFVALQNTTCP